MSDAIAIIDEYLNGHGKAIVEEAESAGLELALACALVEQETGALGNIFGCDHPLLEDPYSPPFCHVRVTAERVAQLLAHVEKYGYTQSSGVGLTQLTWPPLIREAEALGGAHKPRNQLRVGFRVLKGYMEQLGARKGIGAYNGGPSNPNMAYAWDVLEKKKAWERRLA